MEGLLYLEDGTVYEGDGFGAKKTMVGELVFNTSMTGYQEILTDPSYAGQIINLTYPLVGNYGITDCDNESERIHAFGLVAKQISFSPSNALCVKNIDQWLKEQDIPGVCGVDTRAITKKVRESATVKCVISTEGISPTQAKALCEETQLKNDWMKSAGTKTLIHLDPTGGTSLSPSNLTPLKVSVLDLGVKRSILKSLTDRGCEVFLFPYGTSAEELLSVHPDGIFLTNGPGDPAEAAEAIAEIRNLLGLTMPEAPCVSDIPSGEPTLPVPMFGICMGHQLIAPALGGKTFKLLYGHRGGNHGVADHMLGRAYITSQNHGYAVSEESVRSLGMDITHINLNDKTVEGMSHPQLPLFSVQFHPEASPGPQDSAHLFDRFVTLMREHASERPAAKGGNQNA